MLEVDYVGNKLTADGLKPTDERVCAIQNLKDPTDFTELETMLGMVAYVAKFIPHLSDLAVPLQALKCKETLKPQVIDPKIHVGTNQLFAHRIKQKEYYDCSTKPAEEINHKFTSLTGDEKKGLVSRLNEKFDKFIDKKYIDSFFNKAKKWLDLYLYLGGKMPGFEKKSVTPYMHILVYHISANLVM